MLWVPIPIPIFEVAVFMLSLSTYDVFTDGPHVIPGSIPPSKGWKLEEQNQKEQTLH